MKTVAAVNDISGYGRCSLTVAIPVISALGARCCPIPTAVLSNHTGFRHFFIDDYTGKIDEYYGNIERLGVRFDLLLTGFIAGAGQAGSVLGIIKRMNPPLTLVDPVMADEGALYSTYTPEMCHGVRRLAEAADIITPNITEACILAERQYKAEWSVAEIEALCKSLVKLGPKCVAVTGIRDGENILNAAYDTRNDRLGFYPTKAYPAHYSGSGDLFASALAGYSVRGRSFAESVAAAASFTGAVIRHSYENSVDPIDGVEFEPLLHMLSSM